MVRLLDFDSALSREGVLWVFFSASDTPVILVFPICISLGFLPDALINRSPLSCFLFALALHLCDTPSGVIRKCESGPFTLLYPFFMSWRLSSSQLLLVSVSIYLCLRIFFPALLRVIRRSFYCYCFRNMSMYAVIIYLISHTWSIEGASIFAVQSAICFHEPETY